MDTCTTLHPWHGSNVKLFAATTVKKIQILGRNRITSLVFSARINMRNVLDQYAHTNKLDIIEKYVQKSTQFSSELEHNDINLQ